MTRTSGVNATTRTQTVTCNAHAVFAFATVNYGCGWAGTVDVGYDYGTGETWWRCPECAFEHNGLIELP